MIRHDGTRLTQAPEEAAHTVTVPVRRYTSSPDRSTHYCDHVSYNLQQYERARTSPLT